VATSIPIENLYYLLSYAWDHFREGPEVDVSAASCPDLENLLAKVLTNGIHRLARTGFQRDYLPVMEVSSRLKGRIRVAESYRRMTHRSARMICEFDELSHDTPANRILAAVAKRLLRVTRLTTENRHALRSACALLPPACPITVKDSSFRRIQLHRNTRNYRIVLGICRLIHQSFLPEEHEGSRRFRDILRDETVMSRLFEDFVRNFAKRHIHGANVSAMHIGWRASDLAEGTSAMLPRMITDVTVAWPDRKLILDCKYYQEALVSRYDALRFRSGNLYQLNAYLTNMAMEPGWKYVEGMLLYPSNGYHFDHSFTLHGNHRIRVSTLDLQQPWPAIETELLERFSGIQAEDAMLSALP
jgi:5-methylcytosine-specific restriction enzyme subunit McrC